MLALAFALVLPHLAHAADPTKPFVVKGIGAAPCSAFNKADEAKDTAFFGELGGWIDGYITAANALSENTVAVTPWEKTELFILLLQSNCAQNPDLQVISIVGAIVQSWFPDRLREPNESKQVDLGEGRKVTHFVETLRRIQNALKKQGFYNGGIDGDYGPGTRTAMAAFQKSIDLEPTGLPDQLSLLRLLHPSSPPAKN
ncbi:MAG: peptidoglycan-binding domain-containing protein [Proteobacteria bacterium]|nr:peptidoglycan-binding domain-containing protein [Pseudomonadota bacterium]